MTYYLERTNIKGIAPFIINKAEEEGYTVVKFPYARNIRMTAATTVDVNGFTHAITHSNQHNTYPSWHASAKQNHLYWYSNVGSSVECWWQYDFGENNAQVIDAYSIAIPQGDFRTFSTNAPKEWILAGSNDLLDWTPLDEVKDEINWRIGEKRYFKFANVTPYRFYRWTFKSANGAILSINQFDMYNMEELDTKPDQVSAAYLISKGSSTQDRIVLYIDALESYTPEMATPYGANIIVLATVGEFDLTNWKHVDMCARNYYICRNTANFRNHDETPVTLYLDVNKDRIYFATILDASAIEPATNVAYIGMMKRYSKEIGNDALTTAIGMQSLHGAPHVMRNNAGTYGTAATTRFVSLGSSPSVWGGNVFVSPVFLEPDYEGIRGELDGVFTCRTDSLVNEDEILVGDVRYKVILITSYGNCAFPYYCAIFQMPNNA